MLKKTLAATAVAMLLAAPITEAGKQQPVYHAGPIQVDCKTMTADGMRKAIKTALLARKWMPSEKGPGVIAGHLINRTHILDIEVKYSARSFEINYVGSENLMYEVEDGQPVIHRNANLWMQNLERDIQLQVAGNC